MNRKEIYEIIDGIVFKYLSPAEKINRKDTYIITKQDFNKLLKDLTEWANKSINSIDREDINGAEIYAGHIIKITEPDTIYDKGRTFIGVVEYAQYHTGYMVSIYQDRDAYKKDCLWDDLPIHDDMRIEIIGHVDNEDDLLKLTNKSLKGIRK